MKKELRNILLSGALVTGMLGSAMVFAQSAAPTTPAPTQAFTGSVQVRQGVAVYLDLAKVSLQDAIAAAQQATGVTTSPTAVELEVENGYLVWNVTLDNQEILIDAGNGQVLQTAQAEAQDESGDEGMQGANEQNDQETGQNAAGDNEDGDNGSDNGGDNGSDSD